MPSITPQHELGIQGDPAPPDLAPTSPRRWISHLTLPFKVIGVVLLIIIAAFIPAHR